MAVGLCSDRKKIDTWKLEDRANYEKVSKLGQTNIAFFENLDLNLGKYQLYGYYSFDGKKWYINDKIEFEVVDNSILDEEIEIGTIKEIYVEAKGGKLSVGQNSHIGETNRNGEKCVEAYLGEAGAKLEYRVDTTLGGEYELLVRLNDDAVHSDNSRNATIYINETNVKYVHKSEDTKGWKWYSLGSINLEIGENIIIIRKDKTTSAAFIIDAFKFVKK